MSFSGFSGISAADASYANLSNYSNSAGIGSLNLDSSLTDSWAKNAKNFGGFGTSPNIPDYGGDLLNTPAAGSNSTSFVFITAPADVGYSQSAEVNQVSIFGTNNPPVTVSSLNAGELTLGDALMEGFTLGKQVLQPIEDLFRMQEVVLDSKSGFVNVPVYTVYAGQGPGSGRTYGNYVIESIDFKEEMRDLTGSTTRAKVSVAFRQVPDYQIDSGRDQALGGNLDTAQQQAAAQNTAVNTANATRNTPATPGR
jgi:hypothetical protein